MYDVFYHFQIKLNDELTKNYLKSFSTFPKIDEKHPPRKIFGQHSISDDLEASNPSRRFYYPGTGSNCPYCVAAFDLRRRGYDVSAKLSDDIEGVDKKGLFNCYITKNKPKIDMQSRDWNDVYIHASERFSDKSSGAVLLSSSSNKYAHIMSYYMVGKKIIIVDPQSGIKFTQSEISKAFPNPILSIVQTSHYEINWNNVGDSCYELRPDWKEKSGIYWIEKT